MRIGVFDSGIGGEAVANRIRLMLPMADVVSINDHKNVPYGSKTPDEIISLTKLAIKPLIDFNCDVIVIACNTATTIAISTLRQYFPDQHFIGIEPMIKPATLATKTKRIAVFATPGTLNSNRYHELKNKWAKGVTVIEPDCSDWAELIEQGKPNQIDIKNLVTTLKKEKVDVIVLGCTHYHWLKQRITDSAPDVKIMEPSDAIVDRIKSLVPKTIDSSSKLIASV